MSTLKVTNIQATGETASRSATSIAAAWVNLNGGASFGLRDDFNISTAVDNGTGDYTLNFSNALANSDFSVVATCDDSNSSRSFAHSRDYATSSFDIEIHRGDTGAANDKSIVSAAVHGDLA